MTEQMNHDTSTAQPSDLQSAGNQPDLRALIGELDLERLIQSSHRSTTLPIETLRDQVMEVVTQLLCNEERFRYRFANVKALAGYLKRVAPFRAMDALKASGKDVASEQQRQFGNASTPETKLLNALQKKSMADVVEQSLARQNVAESLKQDVLHLFGVVIAEPDRLIRERQSGEQAGRLCFDATAIGKELGWNRQRVYERLSRLREILLQAAKEGHIP